MSNIKIQSEQYIFQKVSKKLSDLVNYIHAVHFPGFDNTSAKWVIKNGEKLSVKLNLRCFHMSSFGESKTKKILDYPTTAQQFVKYNCRQISR